MVKRSFKVSLRDGSASLGTWMEIFSKLLSSEKPKIVIVIVIRNEESWGVLQKNP